MPPFSHPALACPTCGARELFVDDELRDFFAVERPELGEPVLRAQCPEDHRFRLRYVADVGGCEACGASLSFHGVRARDAGDIHATVPCLACGEVTRAVLSPFAAMAPGEGWSDEVARGFVAAWNERRSVRGFVTGLARGGLRVALGGPVAGFLPLELADVRPLRDPGPVVGRAVDCRVVRYDLVWRELVLDRRSVLAEDRAAKKARLLATLALGDEAEGVVVGVADYGAFVDLGGLDALMHVTEMGEPVKVGERVRGVVNRLDVATERVGVRRA